MMKLLKTVLTFSFILIYSTLQAEEYKREYSLAMDISKDGKKAYSLEINDIMYMLVEANKDKEVVKLKCINLENKDQEWEVTLDFKIDVNHPSSIRGMYINESTNEIVLMYEKVKVGDELWNSTFHSTIAVFDIPSKKWNRHEVSQSYGNLGSQFYLGEEPHTIVIPTSGNKYFVLEYDYKNKMAKKMTQIKPRVVTYFTQNESEKSLLFGSGSVCYLPKDHSKESVVYPKQKDKLGYCALAAKGNTLVVGKNNNIKQIRKLDFVKIGEKLPYKSFEIFDLPYFIAISPNEKYVAVFLDMSYQKGRIEVYDLATGEMKNKFDNPSFAYFLDFSDDNTLIATSNTGVNVFNLTENKEIYSRETENPNIEIWSDNVSTIKTWIVKTEKGYKMGYRVNPAWFYFEDKDNNGKYHCSKAEGAFATMYEKAIMTIIDENNIELLLPDQPEGKNIVKLTRDLGDE